MDLFKENFNSKNLLPYGGEVYYYPDFFSREKADGLFLDLEETLSWRQEPIRIFGKMIMQPRLTALYGNPNQEYGYSGISMTPELWTESLFEIKEKIEANSQETFTHVLCNLYRDGQDSMGWHRDNEPILGPEPCIASLTLGAPRVFQLRNYQTKKDKIDLLLQHGSLLIMKGQSQQVWEHQVPKTKKVATPRINLTFRHLK
ncbi:alpha-ketoglutarate-dependent dioxygenase AlkB family protein [Algoriphagus mannitolivorans]|uniref:alpha-ketoglutarate-dependent dioxygenase AlkB family protein n=1 Tax=Algoriphagus mannitolivorans TaxID=226504 RepID=UPI00041895B0|nr:alpha-ketoglutarate-dependent dioxygenase AlkB [Algoriphagus mannitolivorans]